MRVDEVMTTGPVTVGPDASVTEAGHLLMDEGVAALPVVDGERLIGMVSRSDLLRHRVTPDPRAHLGQPHLDSSEPPRTVAQVMSTEPVTLPPGADEADVTALMLRHRIRSIPIVQDGRLVGIVSATDVLRAKLRGDLRVDDDVRARLLEQAPAVAWSVRSVAGVVTVLGPGDDRSRAIAEGIARTVPGVVRVRYAVLSPGTAPANSGAARRITDRRGLEVLDLATCLRLLRSARLGRVAFVRDGAPVVLPVNHVVDGTTVAFRTTWGSKMMLADSGQQVAFEVDGVDRDRRAGWSVLVRGTASRVDDGCAIARYERLPLQAWTAVTPDTAWVAIRADEISGRRT